MGHEPHNLHVNEMMMKYIHYHSSHTFITKYTLIRLERTAAKLTRLFYNVLIARSHSFGLLAGAGR